MIDTAVATLKPIWRWLMLGLGSTIIVVGLFMIPLPYPLGLPMILIGSILVLGNSRWARRRFIKLQRRYPRLFGPLSRLLRRRRRQASGHR